ncbi:GPW/gp25 family protein [Syntrophobotulus glycolicus DSM 8271]|uniref:GPW/gp25 family protein n=1 Tax=Syntrophobotulus glycolicus (strain DSM 8271 / FlGlyR) TaxID=645991 RepID=F0T178_SYNGF|nr:GPW/gp25 family protein [Syntrophobotulus glycolicus]ADY55142.1 GPW/gp25 family protein [Syntrophobotulus glycolicus DSM 8271]
MADEMDGLGTSLSFSLNESLRVNYLGHYDLVSGNENVHQAVQLRLNTPVGSLVLHPEYGNAIFDIISEPMDDDFPVKAELAVRECLATETRINVASVAVKMLNEKRTAQIFIKYSINEDAEITEIMLEVPYGI